MAYRKEKEKWDHVSDELLDIEALNEVMEELDQVQAEWENICIQLKMKVGKLDKISSAEKREPGPCLKRAMKDYLKADDLCPSWRKICAAVASPVGGENRALATEIAKRHPTTGERKTPEAGITFGQANDGIKVAGTGQSQELSRPSQQVIETDDGNGDKTPPPPPPPPPVVPPLMLSYQTATEEEVESLLKNVAVLLLVVNENEYDAVLRYLKPLPKKAIMKVKTENVIFFIGMYGKAISAVVQTRQGLQKALKKTKQALELINPKKIISVGVACGRSPDKQKLADVLVCEIAHDFSNEKQTKDGKVIARAPPKESSENLVDEFMNWRGWKRSRSETTDDPCKVHVGAIISKSTLIDNSDVKKKYFEAVPEAIGAEMEGIGIYTAAEEARVDHILVKAISDWGDGKKNKDWQPFAADIAAHYVHHHLNDE